MNDKGFTLIEIIAIMVVLVAIFLISFPALTNMAKTDEEKKYDNMVTNLCIAGKTYMYANMDEFPQLSALGSQIDVEISKLISHGNVDKNLVNPKTELSIQKDILRYTVLDDFSLDCQYIER